MIVQTALNCAVVRVIALLTLPCALPQYVLITVLGDLITTVHVICVV